MDYTIVGGGVNLASRLEAAATPGEILVSAPSDIAGRNPHLPARLPAWRVFFAPPPVCTTGHLIASPILCMCHAAARSRHGANLAIGEGNQVNSKAPAAPRRYIGLRRA